MKNYIVSLFFIFSSFLYAANGVVDENTVLNFEGVSADGSMQEIGDYYKSDYGITFSEGSLVLGDSDDTSQGNGNFANEPKPGHTIAFFTDTSSLIMNVEKGFTHGFSFEYTSTDSNGTVIVYDDVNGSGKVLKTIQLTALGSDEDGGDPNGTFNRWKTVNVAFNGTAKSVSFAGVANQCGFDNITFDSAVAATALDVSLKLEDISRDTIKEYSDGFSDLFMIKFKDVTTLADSAVIENFCDKYKFKIYDENNESLGAAQTKCTQDLQDPKKIKVNFDINFIDGQRNYFENGVIEICDKGTSECNAVGGIENFAVYGTNFNIRHDAFSFNNGTWNKPLHLAGFMLSDIARITDVINSKYVKEKYRKELWHQVGWYKYGIIPSSKGLCYGMSHVAVAQFNHPEIDESKVWGIGGSIKEAWPKQIANHEEELTTKPIPLKTHNLYQFSNDNMEIMKKIIYYFTAQSSYYLKKLKGKWIGSYAGAGWDITNETDRKDIINILKDGKIFTLSMRYEDESSHAITAVQLINFNNKSKWYTYNNSNGDKYEYLLVDSNYSELKNYHMKDSSGEDKGWKFQDIYVEGKHDPLNIYNLTTTTKAQPVKSMASSASSSLPEETFAYSLFNHLTLSLIGGKYLSVKEKNTGQELSLLPIVDTLEKDKAYSDNANIFNNELYLPNTSVYEVTVQKDASFPFLKLYAKVPNENGEIEIINYENIQSAEDSDTVARFYVGVNNSDKSMKRDDGPGYDADYNKTMPMSITPVESLQAYLTDTGVHLTWVNTQHPNLKETIIVRKEGSAPTDRNDGTVIYTGMEEKYLDDTIDQNQLYYYAAFSVSTEDDVSQAVSTSIDTYKYSVYGKLTDTNKNPITNAQVSLLNSDKTITIGLSTTDANGNYSLNDLTNGTYHLTFEHDSFQSLSKDIQVENKSFEANYSLVGIPTLFMGANNGLKINSVAVINWDGKNINSGQVDVKLFRNNSWKTLFKNLDFTDKTVKWKVTGPADENATLRVSLASDSTVFVEKAINIGDGSINYDLNYDGIIDISDIMQVASKWNMNKNDAKYDLLSDFNNDGKIDISDIMSISNKWGM